MESYEGNEFSFIRFCIIIGDRNKNKLYVHGNIMTSRIDSIVKWIDIKETKTVFIFRDILWKFCFRIDNSSLLKPQKKQWRIR